MRIHNVSKGAVALAAAAVLLAACGGGDDKGGYPTLTGDKPLVTGHRGARATCQPVDEAMRPQVLQRPHDRIARAAQAVHDRGDRTA